jgi:hypothetical protein
LVEIYDGDKSAEVKRFLKLVDPKLSNQFWIGLSDQKKSGTLLWNNSNVEVWVWV